MATVTDQLLSENSPEESYVPVGIGGLLAASEKLLAINRGLIPTDERDSLQFKKILPTHALIRERIAMDSGKIRQAVLRRASKTKSLKGMYPFVFDPYVEGQLVSNPLSSPLEEINPMQLVEQARRMTLMGPGGLGSEDAITEESQAIHPSTFGFISALEGPECMPGDHEVFTKRGWVKWEDVENDDIFACRVAGRLEWHKADRIVREPYKGKLLSTESETLKLTVTPGHRVLFHWGRGNLQMLTARDVFGKSIKLPIRHAPYLGREDWDTFELPDIVKTSNSQKAYGPFDIGDWCEFVGWFLSEGSFVTAGHRKNKEWHGKSISISQCPTANPGHHARIKALLYRMGLCQGSDNGKNFSITGKQVTAYFDRWNEGCYNKWIPEELFEAPVAARERLLDALLSGDGRDNIKRKCYCTVSRNLAESVLQLAIGLGYTAFIREEVDKREHVKTTNWVVSIHRQLNRQPTSSSWTEIDFEGIVYCATVPGGLLHVRGKESTSGHWTGNSSRIGIDSRLSWGTRLGSDGRIYQRFYDRARAKHRWMSPQDIGSGVIGLPE
jgi:hypothetical protein